MWVSESSGVCEGVCGVVEFVWSLHRIAEGGKEWMRGEGGAKGIQRKEGKKGERKGEWE